MRQSALFTKTRREPPRDEVAKNAKLLSRAGFIHKEAAGIYSYLPLGWRVIEKINALIRREMNKLGALELQLSALQDPTPWQASGRWDDREVDFWFKTKLKNQGELGFGATHEEPITRMLLAHLESYRDLPLALYQIQTKFRNETRAKSGILRLREFLMKDLYSFHQTGEDLDRFYERVKEAYLKIFEALEIGDRTFVTFASGGAFSEFSHEFQTVSETGEDTIYLDEEKRLAVNREVCEEPVLERLGLKKEELLPRQAIEVGNIFKLGTRFSAALGLDFLDQEGQKRPVLMASYGLGPTRLLGVLAEVLSDERGLVWPAAAAPFRYHLISLAGENQKVARAAESLYQKLETRGVEVLFDDRRLSAGEKFADCDLLGLPFRIVVSEKTEREGRLEVKERRRAETDLITEAELFKKCSVV